MTSPKLKDSTHHVETTLDIYGHINYFVDSLNVCQAESLHNILENLANIVWLLHEKELVDKLILDHRDQVSDTDYFDDDVPM